MVEGHIGHAFDTDERIRQLKTMLRLYPADADQFSYMELDEFNERPVLPRPDEVVE